MTQSKPSLADAWNQYVPEIGSNLRKHIIQILGHCDHIEEDGTPVIKTYVSTAFLLNVDGKSYVVSAGHCFKSLSWFVQQKNSGFRLVDGVHRLSKPISIPIEFSPNSIIYIDDSYTGLDFGFFPLAKYYAAQIEEHADPSVFVNRAELADNPRDFDMYCMLGFPSESSKIAVKSDPEYINVSSDATLFTLPLFPVSEIPEIFKPNTKLPRFYAELLGKRTVNSHPVDIDGMSGGPIFGIRFPVKPGDSLETELVGVQSAWDKKSVIAAGYVKPLVDVVFDVTDDE